MFGTAPIPAFTASLALHNEELHNLYLSPNIITMFKSGRIWVGHVARMTKKINAYRIWIGKSEAKIPLGRPRRKSEDNIKISLREIGCEVMTGFICVRLGMVTTFKFHKR
jgi:hypothetical protein